MFEIASSSSAIMQPFCSSISFDRSIVSIMKNYQISARKVDFVRDLDIIEKIIYFVKNIPHFYLNHMFFPSSKTLSGKICNHKYEIYRKNKSRTFLVRKKFSSVECIKNRALVRVIFVNGILTNKKSCVERANCISNHLGGVPVYAVHNSSGGPLIDLAEWFNALDFPSLLNLRGAILTTPVLEILLQIDDFFKQFSYGELIIIAHSQGCLHVKNALKEILPVQRKRIHLLFVGPAPGAFIKQNFCSSIVHLTSKGDWIGQAGTFFHTKNVVRINRNVSAPQGIKLDHDFLSSTYQPAIKEHLLLINSKVVNIVRKSKAALYCTINNKGEIKMNNINYSNADLIVRSYLSDIVNVSDEHINEALNALAPPELRRLIKMIDTESLGKINEFRKDLEEKLKSQDNKITGSYFFAGGGGLSLSVAAVAYTVTSVAVPVLIPVSLAAIGSASVVGSGRNLFFKKGEEQRIIESSEIKKMHFIIKKNALIQKVEKLIYTKVIRSLGKKIKDYKENENIYMKKIASLEDCNMQLGQQLEENQNKLNGLIQQLTTKGLL